MSRRAQTAAGDESLCGRGYGAEARRTRTAFGSLGGRVGPDSDAREPDPGKPPGRSAE